MSFQTDYQTLRRGAGIVDRSDRGRITLTGTDRRTYLQGLLSNDIVALDAGSGCYATYLTAQGRMIADMRVFETGRRVVVDLTGAVADSIAQRWSQFVFSEDVQISNESATTAQIGVYGPAAASAVAEAIGQPDAAQVRQIAETLAQLPVYANRVYEARGSEIVVLVGDDIGVRGFDLVVAAALTDDLLAALERSGAVPVGSAAVETCRIEGGRPMFGVDMNADTIPLEAGIEDRAISLTKGCYVGQEVIIRVLHRGHGRVARRLVGLECDPGAVVPSAGERILAGDRDVGSITSAVASPALGRPIALGYVHRDFVEPGTTLTVNAQAAIVAKLPFVADGSTEASLPPDGTPKAVSPR